MLISVHEMMQTTQFFKHQCWLEKVDKSTKWKANGEAIESKDAALQASLSKDVEPCPRGGRPQAVSAAHVPLIGTAITSRH